MGAERGRGDEHGRHHAFDALRTGIPSVNYFALVLIIFFSLFMYFFGCPLGLFFSSRVKRLYSFFLRMKISGVFSFVGHKRKILRRQFIYRVFND
jgi:hypothetical protein